jgi:hypothetical protein
MKVVHWWLMGWVVLSMNVGNLRGAVYQYIWVPSPANASWHGFVDINVAAGAVYHGNILAFSITTPLRTFVTNGDGNPANPGWYVFTDPFSLTASLFGSSAEMIVNDGSDQIVTSGSSMQEGFVTNGVNSYITNSGTWQANGQVDVMINNQPTNQTAIAGNGASFSVSATGDAPMAYQWMLNGTNMPGATKGTLALTGVKAANAGSYVAVVSNVWGAVTSSVATLSVLDVPVTFKAGNGGVLYTNNQVRLSLVGLTGQGPITIQASTNLHDWQSIVTNPAAFGTVVITDTNAGNFKRRFYRAFTPGF